MSQAFNNLKQNIVLDKELEKMLFPLNLMQLVLLQPKYRIVRGSVKLNNVLSHTLWLLGFFCVTLINVFRLIPDSSTEKSKISEFLFIGTIIDVLFYIISCVLMCTLNAYQTKNNVLLILKIQQAYRTVATTGDLKKLRNRTWFCIISILCVYVLFMEGKRQFGLLNTLDVIYVISLTYFDGNIIFATQIINLLVYEVKLWLVEMDRFEAISSQTDHIQLMKHLDEVTMREEALLKAWMDIIGAFKLCGKIFHLQILLRAVEIFIQPLIFIQMFIEISKFSKFFYGAPLMTIVSIIILVLLVGKNLVLLVCVCAASEQFALAVSDVEQACIRLGEDECSDCVRRLRKNVRRVTMCARAAGGLRAGGVVAVDAALPLRLLALLATYTVVLLQFAFL